MNYQDFFLSKKNIINLNTGLLRELDINNISHEHKQDIITILIKNMQLTYNKLKLENINETNLEHIQQQFNKIVIATTLNNINNDNNMLSRPDFEKTNNNNNETKVNIKENFINNNELEQMHQNDISTTQISTRIDNNNNNNSLENYIKQRNIDIPNLNVVNRPNTPTFNDINNNNTNNISNNNTNNNTDNISNNNTNNISNNNTNNNMNNNMNNNTQSNDLNTLEDFNSGDDIYGNINFNTTLLDNNIEIVDDNISLDDKLQMMQKERNNINNIIDNNENINNENINNENINNENINNENINNENINNENKIGKIDTSQTQIHKNIIQQPNIDNSRIKNLESINLDLSNKLNQITSDYNQLKQTNEKIYLNNNNDELKYLELLQKLNNKKNEINHYIINNTNLFNNYKIFLVNSENTLNKNNYVFKLNEEVENVTKIELLSYSLPMITNNITINNNKLKFEFGEEINYDSKYDNIELPEQIKKTYGEIIIIDIGNYTLHNLINYLNSLTKTTKIYFEYINSKIKIIGIDIDQKKLFKIKLIDMPLNNKLGLNVDNKFHDIIYSSESIDLRYDKYISLFLKNISNKSLYLSLINQNSIGTIVLDNYINITELNIEFKDLNNNTFEFNNLDNYLELKFYYKNTNIEIIKD